MCGLLYSGESVEHFFEMVEDFRQPIGAGKPLARLTLTLTPPG